MQRLSHDLTRDVAPALAHARARHYVLAVGPLLLRGVDAAHDLAEDLRQHVGPPIFVRMLGPVSGDPALGGAHRRRLLERSRELAGAKDLLQRHS